METGEEELRLKATLGRIPKSEGTSQKSKIKTYNRKKQKGVDLMLLQQGALVYSQFEARPEHPAQGPTLPWEQGPSPPSEVPFSPHDPVGPREAEGGELALVTEVPFPFPALHPQPVSPLLASFPPQGKGNTGGAGVSFQSCGSCAGTSPVLCQSPWAKPGETQQTEIGTTHFCSCLYWS